MQVHEAAAVVESGGDAGDAVAIRRRLCGGEGPVGVLEEVGRWRHRSTLSGALSFRRPLPYRSATRLILARTTRSRTPLSIFASTSGVEPSQQSYNECYTQCYTRCVV